MNAMRVVFTIGTPIAQVRSPVLLNEYFAKSNMNCIAAPLEVQPEHLPAFVDTIRGSGNCAGLILTIPHKAPAFHLVDSWTTRARALELVNLVRRNPDGSLAGDMVDGVGFWNNAMATGFDPAGKNIVLAGAGAAGTAIAHAFAERGGARLAVIEPETARLTALAACLQGFATEIVYGMPADFSGFEMVINASPVGMRDRPGCVFSGAALASLAKTAIVADAITEPLQTELIAAAGALGLETIDGNAMTAGQIELMAEFFGFQ